MIQRLDCSKCGINQVDTDKPFVALSVSFICQDCFKQQVSAEKRIKELERENRSLKIRLDMYDQDATDLIEEHGCDPEDKIDREVLKRMLNYLIGENRKLKETLTEYGAHLRGCNAEYNPVHKCTCGFDKAIGGLE